MSAGYLKTVYSGSLINAQFIASVLENNDLECIIQDDFHSSMMAGWADPGSENTVRVLVAKDDLSQAVNCIKEAKDQTQN
jgi:phosphoribosylpyrophosphate synthetase